MSQPAMTNWHATTSPQFVYRRPNGFRGLLFISGSKRQGMGYGYVPHDIVVQDILLQNADIGNPNAPVTIQYFGDLECPICKQFSDKRELLIPARGKQKGNRPYNLASLQDHLEKFPGDVRRKTPDD